MEWNGNLHVIWRISVDPEDCNEHKANGEKDHAVGDFVTPFVVWVQAFTFPALKLKMVEKSVSSYI